jgi:ABC-type branched-subunit amino acid transport system ATPase component
LSDSPDRARPAPELEARNLAAGYARVPVISGMDVRVGAGEVAAVIGANGSGKSTLVKAIAGVIELLEGSIEISGSDCTGASSEQLAKLGLGYVPQLNDVFAPLTVEENLMIGGYLLPRRELRQRLEETFAAFPTLKKAARRRAANLSGGERKLVAVAKVLMLRPRLLVLDEPTANLSPDLARRLLQDHVRRLADQGRSVLLVEQRASEALAISDWAYVLSGGRLRVSMPAREFLALEDAREWLLGGDPASRPKSPEGTALP